MIQEHKELLIKDLCARLPYGVKCAEIYPNNDKIVNKWDILKIGKFIEDGIFISNSEETYGYVSQIGNIKPYLYPMSSITEEQKEELYKIGWYLDEDTIYSCFRNYDDVNYNTHTDCFELIDWCYKNHIDINGLIKKGLAIDATGKNIY